MNGGINVNAIYKSIYTINYEEESRNDYDL